MNGSVNRRVKLVSLGGLLAIQFVWVSICIMLFLTLPVSGPVFSNETARFSIAVAVPAAILLPLAVAFRRRQAPATVDWARTTPGAILFGILGFGLPMGVLSAARSLILREETLQTAIPSAAISAIVGGLVFGLLMHVRAKRAPLRPAPPEW
jgi:hypothetical protein